MFIMTDLQVLHPLTGHPQPKGVPWAFSGGEVPAPGKQTEELRARLLSDPPKWLLTHKDYKWAEFQVAKLHLYLNVMKPLMPHYAIAKEQGNYILLRRNNK